MGKFFAMLTLACTLVFSAEQKTIAVTYSILGSLTKELVGDQFKVDVIIPNGQDLHDWKPSAQDAKKVMSANLIVQNGLDAEEGLEKTIDQASKKGVKIFTASDYVQVRKAKHGHDEGDGHGHNHSSGDPHFWLDPVAMKSVIVGLSATIKKEFGVDVSQKAAVISQKLDNLNASIAIQTQTIPTQNKKLITAHQSLGYYAARYNFEVMGVVVPSFSTGAKASAAQLAKLESVIKQYKIPAVFTSIGAPKQLIETISKDTGAKVVRLNDHILPPDDSYYTMMNEMTAQIVGGLK